MVTTVGTDNVITFGHTKPDHNKQIKPLTDLLKLFKRKDIIAMSMIILSSFNSILIFFLTNYLMQMLTGSDPRKKSLVEVIVLTMIGLSNSNKTRYQVGCQSRTNACI
jgi:hypothetical protein